MSELRTKKKILREKGLEYEPEAAVLGEGKLFDATMPSLAPSLAEGEPRDLSTSVDANDMSPDANLATAVAEGEIRGHSVTMKKRGNRWVDPRTTNTFLTSSRVQLLDSIGFVWAIMPDRGSFDERLEQLRQFKEQHGRWPTSKDGTIGNWLKNQKKLYSQKDEKFMTNHCHKVRH